MKPGLKPLIAGILLLIFGVLLVPITILVALFCVDSSEQQFLAPGRTEFEVVEPARFYLWHDHQAVFEGITYNRSPELPDGLSIAVRNVMGELQVFMTDGSISMSSGNEMSQSVGYVDLTEPGNYTVEIMGEADPIVLTFAESRFLQWFALIAGGVVICLLLAGSGIVFTVVGIVKMAQNTGA